MAPVSDRGGVVGRGAELSLDDCRCPVCLEIFMEPVTLPCTHTFCKECFLESVDKTTLCCPLCRKRVSTWARLHSRKNTLVDQKLWTQLQTCFPLQCQRRLNGQDAVAEDDPGVSGFFPRVSQPGELKQEYEDQVTKLTEEKRVLDEEERRASEEFIQRLLQEEQELLQEESSRREDDERVAHLLSSQLNSAPISQENVGPAEVTPVKKKKKKEVSGGQMERFLCPQASNSSSSDRSFMSNKENILSKETLQAEDFYSSSVEDQLQSRLPADAGPSSSKRKSSETTEDKEVTAPKRGCHSLSTSASLPSREEEEQLLSRKQQEEEDWRLAQLLQKELDQEERQRATDRRKGSSDPYLLRQNSRGSANTPGRKTSTSSSAPPGRKTSTSSSAPPGRKNSTSSSPPGRKTSSSTPPGRGSKQATLTEMFSLSS
ncbi:E3 ubiquitin-protein ligase rnf168 [Cottoperca gobio]|uniref:RING-type E3 ubiquitin transferase n=1 Tax=Cottoperca gobio TaxID=56716 RepID=A0A6J2P9T3_COTGO|nr:E3 ubiquitin-protein ligase RNF168 [Cottoperca gobio]XP_029282818.1 E3 ubiquitin-protein ligase RNF168 [Cottoperca gobio]